MKTKRDPYIDIIKAIGILSIVIGHCSNSVTFLPFNITRFVYSYHLMIFFFTAGYCFKETYAETPFLYVGKKIQGILPLFVAYCTFFAVIHNLLTAIQILPPTEHYTPASILFTFFNSFTLSTNNTLLGAFWFLPVLLFAEMFFVFIFSFTERFGSYAKWVRIVAFTAAGVLGILINAKGIFLSYHMQTSILALPVMYLGFILRNTIQEVKKYFTWWVGGISALIIALLITKTPMFIELSVNNIMSPVLFYPVTILGILFCLSTAKLVEKSSVLAKAFAHIGKNSFHIMAFHFLAFKLVDFAYYHLNGYTDPAVLMAFPTSFGIWPLYYVFGVVLSLGVAWVFNFVQKKLSAIK